MKNYIIHVSTDFEREEHIKKEIGKTSFDFIFINDGDKKDLSKDIVSRYFGGELIPVSGATSCAYKHILVYKDMINSQVDYAIVLEDDIFLHKDFEKIVNKILIEITERKLNNFLISLEESNLKYINGSERKKGILLYPRKHSRFTGAYILDVECAKTIMNEIETYKCNKPIDWIHNIYGERGLINVYWLHPTIAVQGSLNGKMKSEIDTRFKRGKNLFRQISFSLTKIYKKLLCKLR